MEKESNLNCTFDLWKLDLTNQSIDIAQISSRSSKFLPSILTSLIFYVIYLSPKTIVNVVF